MALKSIEQEWQGFAAMIFDGCKGISQAQHDEMKKAFFAGYFALFCALNEIGEPHISEEDGERFLTERKAEADAFYKRLILEYAEKN